MTRTNELIASGTEYVSAEFGQVKSWELRHIKGGSQNEEGGPAHLWLHCRVVCGECDGQGKYDQVTGWSYSRQEPETGIGSCEECDGGTFEGSLVSSMCDERELAKICCELMDAKADPAVLPIDADVKLVIVAFETELRAWMYGEKQAVA